MTTSDKFEPSDLELNRIQEEEQENKSRDESKADPLQDIDHRIFLRQNQSDDANHQQIYQKNNL